MSLIERSHCMHVHTCLHVIYGYVQYVLSVCSGLEEMDTAYDSDEDADYTKMDLVRAAIHCHAYVHTCSLQFQLFFVFCCQGNKKGPVKRWDFENEEDYATYQSSREALPKYV